MCFGMRNKGHANKLLYSVKYVKFFSTIRSLLDELAGALMSCNEPFGTVYMRDAAEGRAALR
jgi:hypothetical protein